MTRLKEPEACNRDTLSVGSVAWLMWNVVSHPQRRRIHVSTLATEILPGTFASTESLFTVIKPVFIETGLYFAVNKEWVIMTSWMRTQSILLPMSLEKNLFNNRSAIRKRTSKYTPHWSGDKTFKPLRNVMPVAGLCWLWPIFSVSHSLDRLYSDPLSLPHIFNICSQQCRFD
jgi:hypothetical protein